MKIKKWKKNSKMMLEWISQIGLLKQDHRSNILGLFPLPIRRAIIDQVSQYLYNQLQNQSVPTGNGGSSHTVEPFNPLPEIRELNFSNVKKIPSNTHNNNQAPLGSKTAMMELKSVEGIRWVMEVVGNGFSLPMEDMTIISNCIQIYAIWLLEPSKRPTSFSGDSQAFFQTIFRHMSTLFQPRLFSNESSRNNSSSLAKHCEFCKSVLKLWITAARSLASEFDTETWTVILRVILGTTDSLLKDDLSSFPNLADELGESLLWVLLELWLRSEILIVDMWDALKLIWNRWTHRSQTVSQWSATAFALTLRMSRILYGRDIGSDFMMLSLSNNSVVLDLSVPFLTYSWHRILYLNDKVSSIKPENRLNYIIGIGKIVDVFLIIGSSPISVETKSTCAVARNNSPSGNTILDMFGDILYEAAMVDGGTETDEARAEAFAILCRIFQTVQYRKKFKREYLAKFYHCLSWGIRKSSVALVSIILHGSNLFVSGLDGIKVLFGDFVIALKQVLPKSFLKTKHSSEIIRLNSLCLLKAIISIPARYPEIPISSIELAMEETTNWKTIRVLYHVPTTSLPNEDLKQLKHLRPYLLNMILETLILETNPSNARTLLNILYVFVVQDCKSTPKIVGFVIKIILNEMVRIEGSNHDILLLTMMFLQDLSHLSEIAIENSKDDVAGLVYKMCIIVDNLLLRDQYQMDLLIIKAGINCICTWCCIGNWFLSQENLHGFVLTCLCRAYSLSSGSFTSSTGVGMGLPKITDEESIGASSGGGGGYINTGSTNEGSRMMGLVGSVSVKKTKKGGFGGSSSANTSGATILQQKWQPLSNALFGNLAASSVASSTSLVGSSGNGEISSGELVMPLTLSLESQIQQTAEIGLRRLIHIIDNSRRSPYYPVRVSTLWREQDLIKSILSKKSAATPDEQKEAMKEVLRQLSEPNDKGQRISFYLLNKRVLMTVFEENDDTGNPECCDNNLTVTVILRSVTGCDSWNMKMDLGRLPPNFNHNSLSKDSSSLTEKAIMTDVTTRSAFLWSAHENLQSFARNPDIFANTALHRTRLPLQLRLSVKGENENAAENHLTSTTIPALDAVSLIDPNLSGNIFFHGGGGGGGASSSLSSAGDGTMKRNSSGGLVDTSPGISLANNMTELRKTVQMILGWERKYLDSVILDKLGCGEKSFASSSVSVKAVKEADPSNHRGRIFASQLGLLSLQGMGRICPIPLSETLLKQIDELDTLPERLNVSISVIHVALPPIESEVIEGDKSYDELILRGFFSVSQPFLDFLPQLGWMIDVRNHVGYRGKIDPYLCPTSPYYADANVEAIFHVPCLMNYYHFMKQSSSNNNIVKASGTSMEASFVASMATTSKSSMGGSGSMGVFTEGGGPFSSQERRAPSADNVVELGVEGSKNIKLMDQQQQHQHQQQQLLDKAILSSRRESFRQCSTISEMEGVLRGLVKVIKDDLVSILWVSNPNHPGTLDIERIIRVLGLSSNCPYLVISPMYCSSQEMTFGGVGDGVSGSGSGSGEQGSEASSPKDPVSSCIAKGLYWIQVWINPSVESGISGGGSVVPAVGKSPEKTGIYNHVNNNNNDNNSNNNNNSNNTQFHASASLGSTSKMTITSTASYVTTNSTITATSKRHSISSSGIANSNEDGQTIGASNNSNGSSYHHHHHTTTTTTSQHNIMFRGPLSEGMVVDEANLGLLIRNAAIDGCRGVLSSRHGISHYTLNPCMLRKVYLDRMYFTTTSTSTSTTTSTSTSTSTSNNKYNFASTFLSHLF